MIPNEGEASIPIGRRKHLLKIDDENIHLLDEYNIYVQCRYKFFGREIKKVMAWKKGTSNEKRKLIPLKKIIMKTSKGQEVAHEDMNPLNLLKRNLIITGQPLKKKRKKKLIKRY